MANIMGGTILEFSSLSESAGPGIGRGSAAERRADAVAAYCGMDCPARRTRRIREGETGKTREYAACYTRCRPMLYRRNECLGLFQGKKPCGYTLHSNEK